MRYTCVCIHKLAFKAFFTAVGLAILPWDAKSQGGPSAHAQADIQVADQGMPEAAKPAQPLRVAEREKGRTQDMRLACSTKAELDSSLKGEK